MRNMQGSDQDRLHAQKRWIKIGCLSKGIKLGGRLSEHGSRQDRLYVYRNRIRIYDI